MFFLSIRQLPVFLCQKKRQEPLHRNGKSLLSTKFYCFYNDIAPFQVPSAYFLNLYGEAAFLRPTATAA